ncbi:MAG TPA: signal peptidase II [Yeosuana sp.]
MKLSRRSFFITLTIVLTIAVDQISKTIVRTYVVPSERSNIIGTYFTLHNVENVGAFLGMGSDLSPLLKLILLLILPIVVLSFVTYHIFKDQSLDKVSVFAFASIIGGGIANVFDRVVYGSVTDFFHINLGGIFRTGIFNMADLSVTTGMILLLFVSFKKKKEATNQD